MRRGPRVISVGRYFVAVLESPYLLIIEMLTLETLRINSEHEAATSMHRAPNVASVSGKPCNSDVDNVLQIGHALLVRSPSLYYASSSC